MSNVVNLITYGNPEFKLKRKSAKTILPIIPKSVEKFLQVIPINEAPIVTCCCLKDVGNTENKGSIAGPFNSYRVSMMTFPKGMSYVNYKIKNKNNPKVEIVSTEAPLDNLFQTLLLFDINAPITNFHYCDNGVKEDGSFVSPRIACVDTLTSLRGSDYKPFHIFSMEFAATDIGFYPSFNSDKAIKGLVYLVPFSISEGVVIYFIIENNIQNTLNALSDEITKTQNNQDGKHHWFITSEIIYQDTYGVFTCTKIKSINNVSIGG